MDFFTLGNSKNKRKTGKNKRKTGKNTHNKKSNKSKKYITKTTMNCSPMVEGQTISVDTCYTSDALVKIVDAYNKNKPNNKIVSTDPKIMLTELKTKLTKCKKEDCWLSQLPESERLYLDKYLFAPDKPSEWKKNANEWLSNIDIFEVLRQYEEKYKNFKLFGPTPIDFDTRLPEENNKCVEDALCTISLKELIKTGVNKIGVVFNLDKHDEDGSHWTSLFIDIDEKVIFYFDSADNDMPREVRALVKKLKIQGKQLDQPIAFRLYSNKGHSHQSSNTECGMYSLFFIITMLTSKTEFDENMLMPEKIRLFKKKKIPDKYVEKYRNIYFNN